MPFPSSNQDLQRFLGMIAYLSKFIPQLSEKTHLLRELLKKDSIWDFTLTHRDQFDKLRSMVSENISLKFFDPKFSSCDSSKSRNHLSPELKPYYNLRDELTVVSNLILKGNKIVIPSTGHLGIERTKSNARSTMYWPNIDKNINEMISNCNACQKYRNLNPREPLFSHEIPKDVWNKVATDLFVSLNKLYLIVIDYTSKYFEIAQLPDASSDTVITHMRSIFARHGIPKVVFSDNGPQYSSLESWDFIHKTSSPEFPQSSGFVERAIQTIKKTQRKCREDDSAPLLAMLALRTTKNSSGTSASEMLMKRKLQTLVPPLNVNANTKTKLMKPTLSQSRELQPFNRSDTVRYRQNNNWTRTGIILNKSDMPRSYTL